MPREKPLAVGAIVTGAKNEYQVKRLVGGGGMAWVYQVEKLPAESNSLWALKELRPQTQDPETQAHARQLFSQEAILLSQLSHPNLPQVIDFFEQDGRAYLVMEFIWGESLEKRVEKARSPLMERQVLQWAVQICDVLDYLHTRQPPIIFRDLKPSNIMVNNAGAVKLVDFGIARTYKEGKLQDTIALGSENYAAPEQWGEEQTDPRSDIYALGATMYHLLANMPPSPAFLPSEPTSLNELNTAVSPDTVAIVTKAMTRDRKGRYSSVKEMKQALLAGLPDYAAASLTPVSPGQTVSRAAATPPKFQATAPQPALQQPVTAAQPTSQPTTLTASKAALTTPNRLPKTAQPSPAVQQPVAVQQPAPRPLQTCPQCNHKNERSARFCVKCGYAFGGLRPAVLRVVEPVRAAWEMPVKKSPLMLGRANPVEGYRPDFDMTFYDPQGYVSRRHAHIIKAKNGYFIADLASSNGTLVNGQLLTPGKFRKLRHGDKIEIGEVGIHFLLR